jgi:hypothetical protein
LRSSPSPSRDPDPSTLEALEVLLPLEQAASPMLSTRKVTTAKRRVERCGRFIMGG